MSSKVTIHGSRKGKTPEGYTIDFQSIQKALERMRRDDLRREMEWKLDRRLSDQEFEVLLTMHDMGD